MTQVLPDNDPVMSSSEPMVQVVIAGDLRPDKPIKQKEVQGAYSSVRLRAGSGARQIALIGSKVSTRKRALVTVFTDQMVFLCSSQSQAQADASGSPSGMVMTNGSYEITSTGELWISTQENTNGWVGIAQETVAP